jgi:hypothetical protein
VLSSQGLGVVLLVLSCLPRPLLSPLLSWQLPQVRPGVLVQGAMLPGLQGGLLLCPLQVGAWLAQHWSTGVTLPAAHAHQWVLLLVC